MHKIERAAPAAEQKVEKLPTEEKPLEEWFELMSDIARGTSEETRVALAFASNASLSIATLEVSAERAAPTTNLPVVLSETQRQRLHEDLRAALNRNSDTRLALERLQNALALTTNQRDVIAEKLLQVCPRNGPMAALVQALMSQQERREAGTFDDLELPAELRKNAARMGPLGTLSVQDRFAYHGLPCADWPCPRPGRAGTGRPRAQRRQDI